MTLLRVTPEVIQNHANAILQTVASLENHQGEITKIIQNPELQMSGLNDSAIQEAHQSLNSALTTLNGHHTSLAAALVAHSNATTETDAALARQVH